MYTFFGIQAAVNMNTVTDMVYRIRLFHFTPNSDFPEKTRL
jgi:hypothetical protein